jgi:hypothetical protein
LDIAAEAAEVEEEKSAFEVHQKRKRKKPLQA